MIHTPIAEIDNDDEEEGDKTEHDIATSSTETPQESEPTLVPAAPEAEQQLPADLTKEITLEDVSTILSTSIKKDNAA